MKDHKPNKKKIKLTRMSAAVLAPYLSIVIVTGNPLDPMAWFKKAIAMFDRAVLANQSDS